MNRLDWCSKTVEINSKPLKLLAGLHIIIQGNWTKEPNQIIFQKARSILVGCWASYKIIDQGTKSDYISEGSFSQSYQL